MTDHLDRAAAIVGGCCAHCDDLVDERLALLDEAGLLASPERDAEVRADERGRCSVVHATLSDEALVAELVRRGVLEVECETRDSDRPTDCWEHGAAKGLCEPRCTFKWYPPVRVKRHVSPWQPVADEGGAS